MIQTSPERLFERECLTCHAVLPLSEFHRGKCNKFGRIAKCKSCVRGYRAERAGELRIQRAIYNHFNRDRLLESSLRKKLISYCITQEDYEAMVARQAGCCAICKRPFGLRGRRMSFDHDHGTGRMRALLCLNCNSALGLFDDNVEALRAAILYLEHHTDDQT